MATTVILLMSIFACSQPDNPSTHSSSSPSTVDNKNCRYPRIASWLAKKDEIIASQQPYALVMSGWFTPQEASQIKAVNPDALLLSGLTVNWVYDDTSWLAFLISVANYGHTTPFTITEEMYLHDPSGNRVAFGWASADWGHPEIFAMDPRNPVWVDLITAFYKNVLSQPQHDGIIVDMVTEKSWNTSAISDLDWIQATRKIMAGIIEANIQDKLVIFNSGKDFSEIDTYSEFMDGFLMENCLGSQFGASFNDAFQTASSGKLVIYAVDTDDTGQQDMSRLRLGLVLSLLFDNTFFTYDFGSRNHGQSWWYREYDVNLGKPLGTYYRQDNAYYRQFEKGLVVASPYSEISLSLEYEYLDITSGITASSFRIARGDARIFLLP